MKWPVPYLDYTCASIRLALGTALVLFASTIPALADDPFDMEPSSWVSFDRYREKPTNWIPPEVRAQAAAEPVVIAPPTLPANMPAIGEPNRTISTPPLPGINADLGIHVSSTADDNNLPVVLDANTADLTIPKSSWKDAVQFAHNKKALTSEDSDSGLLDVRFTYLPTMIPHAVKPKNPAFESMVKKTEVAAVKPPVPVTVATPPAADPAICAAIDAYKKRQLAAIESDRQTLSALQTAIAQLGLQKKLDFMVGASGNLKMQDAPAPMDMPVAKN